MSVQKAAANYLKRELRMIPVPFGSKIPVLTGWQALRLEQEDLEQYFNGRTQNVGGLMGGTAGEFRPGAGG